MFQPRACRRQTGRRSMPTAEHSVCALPDAKHHLPPGQYQSRPMVPVRGEARRDFAHPQGRRAHGRGQQPRPQHADGAYAVCGGSLRETGRHLPVAGLAHQLRPPLPSGRRRLGDLQPARPESGLRHRPLGGLGEEPESAGLHSHQPRRLSGTPGPSSGCARRASSAGRNSRSWPGTSRRSAAGTAPKKG